MHVQLYYLFHEPLDTSIFVIEDSIPNGCLLNLLLRDLRVPILFGCAFDSKLHIGFVLFLLFGFEVNTAFDEFDGQEGTYQREDH